VNARDEDGNTPHMINKSAAAVTRLLSAGANPYLRNKKRQTASIAAHPAISLHSAGPSHLSISRVE
jgi:ankyrin repeat protein